MYECTHIHHSVCICMNVYMHMCCMHIDMFACETDMHVCMYICMYVARHGMSMHACLHVNMYVYTETSFNVCMLPVGFIPLVN